MVAKAAVVTITTNIRHTDLIIIIIIINI